MSGWVFLARYASKCRRARSYWAPETKKPIRENRFDLKMAEGGRVELSIRNNLTAPYSLRRTDHSPPSISPSVRYTLLSHIPISKATSVDLALLDTHTKTAKHLPLYSVYRIPTA